MEGTTNVNSASGNIAKLNTTAAKIKALESKFGDSDTLSPEIVDDLCDCLSQAIDNLDEFGTLYAKKAGDDLAQTTDSKKFRDTANAVQDLGKAKGEDRLPILKKASESATKYRESIEKQVSDTQNSLFRKAKTVNGTKMNLAADLEKAQGNITSALSKYDQAVTKMILKLRQHTKLNDSEEQILYKLMANSNVPKGNDSRARLIAIAKAEGYSETAQVKVAEVIDGVKNGKIESLSEKRAETIIDSIRTGALPTATRKLFRENIHLFKAANPILGAKIEIAIQIQDQREKLSNELEENQAKYKTLQENSETSDSKSAQEKILSNVISKLTTELSKLDALEQFERKRTEGGSSCDEFKNLLETFAEPSSISSVIGQKILALDILASDPETQQQKIELLIAKDIPPMTNGKTGKIPPDQLSKNFLRSNTNFSKVMGYIAGIRWWSFIVIINRMDTR